MTCIAGLVGTDGKVWMGCDSLTSADYGLASINAYKKLGRIGDFLIGIAGSARAGQILRHAFVPPVCEGDVHVYMAGDFVKAVQETLERAGEKEAFKDTQMLVGFRGRLFCICSNWAVMEDERGYHAIGIAQEAAMGALYMASQFVIDGPEHKIRCALYAAEELNCFVQGPFIIESV